MYSDADALLMHCAAFTSLLLCRLNISNMAMGDANVRVFFNILTVASLGNATTGVLVDLETADDGDITEAITTYEAMQHPLIPSPHSVTPGTEEISSADSVNCSRSPRDGGIGEPGGTLRSLRVTNNKIEEAGARAIARYLRYGGSGLAEVRACRLTHYAIISLFCAQ